MSPLYDFKCPRNECGKTFESLMVPWDEVICPQCGGYPCERQLSLTGGYSIKGDNSASVRPKQAGSFKKKKE